MRGYYFITDSALSRAGNRADVAQAILAGAQVIQYREKNLCTRDMLAEAKDLRALCREAKFIVNDRLDIALAVDAEGVHLGQEDMPLDVARKLLGHEKIIGVTVHTVQEAEKALNGGADYLGVSPIFSTQTKLDAGTPAGLQLVSQVKQISRVPIVAIGGITLMNASSVIAAGADCVCAISAVVTKTSVQEAVLGFQALFK